MSYTHKTRQTPQQEINNISKLFMSNPKETNLNTLYRGHIHNNMKTGFGIETRINAMNNEQYTLKGIFNNNILLNSFGIISKNNKRILKGEFLLNQINGYAEYKSPTEGVIYEGEWNKGYMHGIGVEKGANGFNYSGEYIKGNKQGIGIITESNGNKYYGEVSHNCYHGYGIYQMANKGVFMGQFEMNRKNGYGEYVKGNMMYIGFWVNDLKQGFGIEINKDDGVAKVGYWKKDKLWGVAKVELKNKGQTPIMGLWKNGYINKQMNDDEFLELINQTYCDKYNKYFNKNYHGIVDYCEKLLRQ